MQAQIGYEMNYHAFCIVHNVALLAAFVVLTVNGFWLAWLLIFLLKDGT